MELRDALLSLGYSVSPTILQTLVSKYDKTGQQRGSESIATVPHRKAVHSAYFSPSGSYLATTSYDNNMRLLDGHESDPDDGLKTENKYDVAVW